MLIATVTVYCLLQEVVYIAGDNDVGGEGLDLLTEHKMKRFRKHFPNTPTKQHKFVTFVSVSTLIFIYF